eukprot:536126-Hanusia_phi.AAC.1
MSLICLDDFLGDEFHLLGKGSKSTKPSFIVDDSGRQAHAALRIHLTQRNGLAAVFFASCKRQYDSLDIL